jgi:hypothetical protein
LFIFSHDYAVDSRECSGKLAAFHDRGQGASTPRETKRQIGGRTISAQLLKKGGFMPWKLASLGTLLAVAMLAGCSTTSTESTTDPVTTSDTGHSRCEAKAAEFTIGKKASPELLEQARTRAGAQNARFLLPTDMVTLEYRSDRLNLNTDASRVVTRVNCG